MPRFNPPPGWDVPAGFMPPVGWRPDPRWPAAPPSWPLWIVDPAGPTAPQDDDPELTWRRPAGPGDTHPTRRSEAELGQTLAWSPAPPPAHSRPARPPHDAPSGHSAPSGQSASPASASSPLPATEWRRPWYERPAPAAVAASTCVAVVAVSIWAFVLRESPADAEDGPGKFDVEPPPDPGGDQGNRSGGEQAPAPSALPEQDGDTVEDGTGADDAPDDANDDAPADMPGLRMSDTYPPGQDATEHTGPDGVPTNTAPIGTEADLLLENPQAFGHRSVMSWTMNSTGEMIEAQLVGETDWDATDEVVAHDAQNPPAPDGHVYVTQRIRVTTDSPTPFHPFQSVLVYWVSDSGDVYGATTAVGPDDLVDVEPVADGSEVEGNLVLCLPEDVVENGHWVVAINHSSNGYLLAP